MPFTLAHAAAVLPFRRTVLVWSALVIGSFAPDLEYFIRFAPDNRYGHTLVGSILLSLPLAVLTLWLFHRFVKKHFIEILPEGIRRRLGPRRAEFQFHGVGTFIWIIVSILLGMATHLGWDSFTHSNAFFYRHWALLREQTKLPVIGMVPVYKVLQHGSTIVGLVALSIWLALWYREAGISRLPEPREEVSPSQRALLLIVVSLVALSAAVLRSFVAVGMPSTRSAVKQSVGLFVVTLVAVVWWEFVLYGVWTRMREKTAKP